MGGEQRIHRGYKVERGEKGGKLFGERGFFAGVCAPEKHKGFKTPQ